MAQTSADKEKAKTATAQAEEAEDQEETSELESALFKMMRMQYGILAGGAKGVSEMAGVMETFLDSLADETDIKASEDWRALIESAPDAMVTASRKAMNRGDQAAQAVLDAYRRYSEAKA